MSEYINDEYKQLLSNQLDKAINSNILKHLIDENKLIRIDSLLLLTSIQSCLNKINILSKRNPIISFSTLVTYIKLINKYQIVDNKYIFIDNNINNISIDLLNDSQTIQIGVISCNDDEISTKEITLTNQSISTFLSMISNDLLATSTSLYIPNKKKQSYRLLINSTNTSNQLNNIASMICQSKIYGDVYIIDITMYPFTILSIDKQYIYQCIKGCLPSQLLLNGHSFYQIPYKYIEEMWSSGYYSTLKKPMVLLRELVNRLTGGLNFEVTRQSCKLYNKSVEPYTFELFIYLTIKLPDYPAIFSAVYPNDLSATNNEIPDLSTIRLSDSIVYTYLTASEAEQSLALKALKYVENQLLTIVSNNNIFNQIDNQLGNKTIYYVDFVICLCNFTCVPVQTYLSTGSLPNVIESVLYTHIQQVASHSNGQIASLLNFNFTVKPSDMFNVLVDLPIDLPLDNVMDASIHINNYHIIYPSILLTNQLTKNIRLFNPPLAEQRQQFIYDKILNLVDQPSSWLDLGCGNGSFILNYLTNYYEAVYNDKTSSYVKNKLVQIIGLDINRNRLDELKVLIDKLRSKYLLGNHAVRSNINTKINEIHLYNNSFIDLFTIKSMKSNSYDIITCIEVIEHLPSIYLSIYSMANILIHLLPKILIISTPNYEANLSIHKEKHAFIQKYLSICSYNDIVIYDSNDLMTSFDSMLNNDITTNTYSDMTERLFREKDHKFEFTRNEFVVYINDLLDRLQYHHSNQNTLFYTYTYVIDEVGGDIIDTDKNGKATQIVTFYRVDREMSESNRNDINMDRYLEIDKLIHRDLELYNINNDILNSTNLNVDIVNID